VVLELARKVFDLCDTFFWSSIQALSDFQTQSLNSSTLSLLQEEFNEVDARLRFNASMKEELAEKVSELRDALWQECDARREESGREKAAQAAKGRVGSHVAEISRAHAELAQKEVGRSPGI
jgi:predicted transcriptional regulator